MNPLIQTWMRLEAARRFVEGFQPVGISESFGRGFVVY